MDGFSFLEKKLIMAIQQVFSAGKWFVWTVLFGTSLVISPLTSNSSLWAVDPAAVDPQAVDPATPSDRDFFIGGFGKGISVAKYRSIDGSFSTPTLACSVENPSYLCQHPTLPVLYAVRETSRTEKTKGKSAIFAFRWNPDSRQLEQMSETPVDGDTPCHVSVDAKGKFAFVANYSSGCVLVYAIAVDGRIERELDHVQHEPRSNTPIVKNPRAHSIRMDPTNRWTLVADLGLDRVFVYRFDAEHGKLLKGPIDGGLQTLDGAGPRQLAFHPNGKFLFVINELNSTLTAASWDSEKGVLKETSTLSTLPAEFQGKNSTAAVVVNASGDRVYGSNRGHDSIAAFRFNEATGKLTSMGHQLTGGKTPRDFRITPDGRFLLAQNQQSDSITVLAIDEKTGQLTATGKQFEVLAPACIEFLNVKK